MARKSKAQTDAATAKGSSKRKPETHPPATISLAKRPKRQSTSKQAPTKSDYFSQDSSENDEEEDESAVESPGTESSELDSLPDEDELDVESNVSDEEEDFDEKPKRSRGSGPAKKNSIKSGSLKSGGKASQSTKSELWRPGVPTGLEPGTQVVIKKPKARDAGTIPYSDSTVHPNTLLFLEDLAANNNRGWLKSKSKVVSIYIIILPLPNLAAPHGEGTIS